MPGEPSSRAKQGPGDTAAFAAFMLRTRALAALRRTGITTVGQLRALVKRMSSSKSPTWV
jgi:hypothetical protein